MKREGYEETVEFKVRDIKKAYDNACPDGKKVLKDMCPEVFENKYCCDWMREMVEGYKIFKLKTLDTQHHPLFLNSSKLRLDEYITNNGLFYCPRCGNKL